MTESKDVARYELKTALLDGLFESMPRVKNAHLQLRQLETTYDHKDSDGNLHRDAIYLRVRAPYALGPHAEDILLAILRKAGTGGLQINPEQPALPFLLAPEEQADAKTAGAAVTTEYELLQAAGFNDSGEAYRLLRYYLDLMSEVRVHYRNKVTGWRGGDFFLRYRIHDDGRIEVQVNWRLAGALFGEYMYAPISLSERRQLAKDASKTLHRWLSAHVWPGKRRTIRYDSLAAHVWTSSASRAALYKRKNRLRQELLPEIEKLDGWTVTYGPESVTIERAQIVKPEASKGAQEPVGYRSAGQTPP